MTSDFIYLTKLCTKCNIEKPFNEFYKDKRGKHGLYAKCKACHNSTSIYWGKAHKDLVANSSKQWRVRNLGKLSAKQAKRRASKLRATPSWCEVDDIKRLYTQSRRISELTGIPHQVDHIVPLQSELVCGLHCLANLRIVTAQENGSKGNYRWPDMP